MDPLQQARERGLIVSERGVNVAALTGAAAGPIILECEGLVVLSEANRVEHWAKKHKRKVAQRTEIALRLSQCVRPKGPVVVTFTLTGGRKVDGCEKRKWRMDDDNLAIAFKVCRDAVATWLKIDDGDTAAATWQYRQEVGWRGIRVEIVEVLK